MKYIARPASTKIKGFTLVEVLVALAIVLMLTVAIANFSGDVFGLGRSALVSLDAEWSARRALKTMAHDIRLANLIEETGTSTLAFEADIDGDGLPESVRYGLEASRLVREEDGVESTLLERVGNSASQPIFVYQGDLVRVSIISGTKTYATSVMPRNLNDNE